MNRETAEDEFDLATAEFMKAYNAFRKSAKNLMAIMDTMIKKNHRKSESLSGENQQTHEFLIQMMDDSGHQIEEKCFGIRCVAGEEKKRA